jgi:phage shock protein PspC (stress-responsive transcriptional regulator)
MSTTPPEAPAAPPAGPENQGPRTSREELRNLGSIRRTIGPQRKLAGVAGGLARHLDIDPIILRVALVVLVFFGGAGLLLYAAGWVLLPEEGTDRAPLALDERSRTAALVVFGAIGVVAFLGDGLVGGFGVPWPLIGVAALALVVLVFVDRDRPTRQVPTAPPVPHTYDAQAQGFVPAQPGTWTRPLQTPPPTPPASYGAPAYARPRNPRKRGPILFWFTLFAAALAVGVLGIVDLAGVDVAPAAYPALVTGVFATMLLVGSVWGRAGGLILVGLIAAVGTGATAVASEFDPVDVRQSPTTAAAVTDFDEQSGRIELDLTDVTDLAALDGRTLDLHADFGAIRVIVPEGLSVQVRADVSAGGNIDLFSVHRDGFDLTATDRYDAGPGAPELLIDADVRFGDITIWTETQP